MKNRTFCNWSLGVGFSIFLLTAAGMQTAAEPAPAPSDKAEATPANQPAADAKAEADLVAPAPDSDAPVKFVSSDKPLPANIKPSSPVNEVIKLANSGVAEPVILAYVTNSVHTFNLGAEEIIYLNDLGVPGPVVTAMIQRDQELKASFAAAATPPQPPAPEPMPPEQTPPPDATAPYAVEAPLTPPDDGSGDMFYDSLAPYGNWVDVEGYGRCWQPTVVVVNGGWQPYFDCGHWVYSDCGWYWLSDYSWGWAPFHYGSWFRHGRLGWCWVPGHVWGPSWVSWRYNDHSCGWAPLPPGAHFVAGTGLTFHGHSTWDRDDFGLRPSHYHFVAWNHFNDRQLSSHNLPPRDAVRAYEQSTVATRINGDGQHVINNGLPPSRVAAATHRPVHTVALRESAEPVLVGGRAERFEAGGQTLAVFRPRVDTAAGRTPGNSATGVRPGSRASSPTLASSPAAPWSTRAGTVNQSSMDILAERNATARQQTSPLILRGAQKSALKETAPPSPLVVIGHGDGQPSAASARPAPSAPSAASWARSSSALPARPDENVVSQRRPAADQYQNQQPDWRGTVTRSPQPSWFGDTARPATSVPGAANAGSRPDVRTYQPAQRAPMAEVPRYAPSPSYVPQRSYSAPSWSAPSRPQSYSQPAAQPSMSARPAAPAPSAPTAAPAPSSASHSSGSSSRNGR